VTGDEHLQRLKSMGQTLLWSSYCYFVCNFADVSSVTAEKAIGREQGGRTERKVMLWGLKQPFWVI